MSTRQEVYKAIDGERDYQDSLRKPTPEQSVEANTRFANITPILSNEIGIVKCLADDALRAISYGRGPFGSPGGGLKETEDSRDMLRKIAAVCVRALETHGAKNR